MPQLEQSSVLAWKDVRSHLLGLLCWHARSVPVLLSRQAESDSMVQVRQLARHLLGYRGTFDACVVKLRLSFRQVLILSSLAPPAAHAPLSADQYHLVHLHEL